MAYINVISRRNFIERSLMAGAGLGLAALTNIPLVMKRALATGIGTNGKKLLFIFLRGANDSLNTLSPMGDSNFINLATGASTIRPTLILPRDPGTTYPNAGLLPMDFPINAVVADPDLNTSDIYNTYPYSIRVGNGFSAVHNSLKFLAPVYNGDQGTGTAGTAGYLAMVHRVGYPKQSRSHFDSQNYWENGTPNNNLVKDGIFYRTMVESGLATGSTAQALTGVAIQNALPAILAGEAAAMLNLPDPTRYDLLGIPNTTAGNSKALNAITNAQNYPFPDRKNRELLKLQYKTLPDTLSTFAAINFTEGLDQITPPAISPGSPDFANYYVDNVNTDNDHRPYYLFPTTNIKNGGWRRPGGANVAAKYVVPPDSTSYNFFKNLKAAALVLGKTNAIIAGTELGGFDTHNNQIGATSLIGTHADLQQRIGWAIFGLYKFFNNASYSPMCSWNDVVIVTMSEFGRTTIQNSTLGSDHAEATCMLVAGGSVKGYNSGLSRQGIYAMHTDPAKSTYNSQDVHWVVGTYSGGSTGTGTLFDATGRYLKRAVDYRSVLGEVIRKHLGATDPQINNIIPGYANESNEHLRNGGLVTAASGIDSVNTLIAGEVVLL